MSKRTIEKMFLRAMKKGILAKCNGEHVSASVDVFISSAYRYHRISLSLAWQGDVRTGFSGEIGMRGRAAPERKTDSKFGGEFLRTSNNL